LRFWKKSKPLGLLGGICLDNYKRIPKPYDRILSIGKGVMIKTGTILCGEGFHFSRFDDRKLYFNKHNFGVEIGDDIWIGSNCTIDRGRWRHTRIDRGVKIDNGVHISHNVVIEPDCIIGTGAILLGSCEIGEGSEIWSNAIIHQKVKVGKNCAVGANTYLRHDLKDNMCAYISDRTGKLVIKHIDLTKKYKKGGVSKLPPTHQKKPGF